MSVARTAAAPWNTTMSQANLDAANYVPQLYAKKVLYEFQATTIWNEVTNTDYEGSFKNQGDSILIRQAPAVTTSPYTVGLGITYEALAANSQELVIDQAQYQAFQVDDIDAVQTDINLLNMYATDASGRLKNVVDTDVLQVMAQGADAANQGATAGAVSGSVDLGTTGAGTITITTANAVEKLVEMEQVLREQNIPDDEMFAIIPYWYATQLKTSDLKQANITGDPTGVIRTGLIGMINNMKVYVSNNVYNPLATDWYVVAGTKMATTFALQLSKTETLRNPESFGEFWRTLYVYGRKVVRSEGIATMICDHA